MQCLQQNPRGSLIRAKLREGMNRLPDTYDLSLDSAVCDAAWLRVEGVADGYVKGDRTLDEVREAFKVYAEAHEIAPTLF